MTYPPQGPPPHGPQYPPSGYPTGPQPFGATAARDRSRRRLTWILAAIVAVLALVVGLGALKLYSDKTGKDLFPSLTLRSADEAGPDPFTSSVALTRQNGTLRNRAPVAVQQGVQVVNGTDPGLYATGGTASCDVARLGNELSANPAAGRAWASAFGIGPSDIPWYLNTLSPVILTADTWVTNHTYTGGVARPFQSVLQSGTAVLVDGAGVPRVQCACGNPLLPPSAAPIGGYRVHGHPWHNYESRQVTRITTVHEHVTTVNNTTTIVNNPAPAPIAPLQVTNIINNALEALTVGGTLELPETPADVQLPDPVQANATPTFENPTDAALAGVEPGTTNVVQEVAERAAANNDVPQTAAPSEETVSNQPGTESAVTEPSVPVPGAPEVPSSATEDASTDPSITIPGAPQPTESTPTPAETTAPSTDTSTPVPETSTVPETTTSTSAAPTPTSFSGSGDVIGSLSFTDSGSSVTCTVPSTFESSTVTATCSDGTDRSFSTSSLTQSGVSAATSDSVWTVSTSSGESLTVSSASWQTAAS